MSADRLDFNRTQVYHLKAQFEELQQEIITKLKECGSCIDSAERFNEEAGTLVQNLKDSLATVSNDAKEWQDIRAKLASTAIKGKVTLNVGGIKYTTSVENLTREKNSFFTAMFSRQWQLERDPKDDSIFIDRDGELFVHILSYLRTDTVPSEIMANEALRQKLILEAKYFHLHNFIKILTEPERKAFWNGGSLLSDDQKGILIGFLDNSAQKAELIYKASRDGFDPNAFHSRCNNKGPTVTIVQTYDNYLFGGYTSVSWTSLGNYAVDPKAFLFTLVNPYNIPPTKYPVQPSKTLTTVYHCIAYGPTFGEGYDLHVCANSNSCNGSYTGFPTSYTDTTGYGKNTFTGSYNFSASDIEVYQLT